VVDYVNKIYVTLILILFSISASAVEPDSYDNLLVSFGNPTPESRQQADSIMKYVTENASLYANAITRYKAEIYIKGRTQILKQNRLIYFAHHLFPVDRKKKDVIFEMITDSEFEAPNLYKHNFRAINGNTIPNRKKQDEVITFLNMNVYAPTIYDESIITPVGRKAFKYYEFNLEKTEEEDESIIYKIRFIPKQSSGKLVKGDLYVRDGDWRIEKVDMTGRFDFAEFNLSMTFGHEYGQLILPNKADLTLYYNILGNKVLSSYHSSFKYKDLEWKENIPLQKGKRQWKPLDMTQYYTIASDSVPFIRDTSYWNKMRDVPLTREEKKIYLTYYPQRKKNDSDKDTTEVLDYLKLTEQLTSNIHYDFHSTRIKYSGILNPFQLGYSSRHGITYKQELRITKTFKDERQLIIRPEVGFVFKRKEIFLKLRSEWNYLPEKKGLVQLTLANDNQTYSSQMMNDINEHLTDSIFNFNDLNLDYYRHYYIDLQNNIEISNGFQFTSGLSFHRREPVKKKTDVDPGSEIGDIMNETYYDFIPAIGFTYTPRQFYRMIGRRKEYVYSYYPTMSIEIAQGIPGVFGSTGNYGRVELDIHQSLKLDLTRRFNYHVSGGLYTRKKSTYFAEFKYFTRRNFPESWDDDRIGGVFHTLRSEWFNASDKYVQTHMMYQSPFILLHFLNKKVSRYVLSERIYSGTVWTPAVNWYSEIGYGIGNEVFNIAIFAGFKKGRYQDVGFRFSFEID